ncbi:hypothetical protein VCHENC02_0666B, partial [Vibrio harveyi]
CPRIRGHYHCVFNSKGWIFKTP